MFARWRYGRRSQRPHVRLCRRRWRAGWRAGGHAVSWPGGRAPIATAHQCDAARALFNVMAFRRARRWWPTGPGAARPGRRWHRTPDLCARWLGGLTGARLRCAARRSRWAGAIYRFGPHKVILDSKHNMWLRRLARRQIGRAGRRRFGPDSRRLSKTWAIGGWTAAKLRWCGVVFPPRHLSSAEFSTAVDNRWGRGDFPRRCAVRPDAGPCG